MTERVVQLGMATYTDPEGVRRIGVHGEQVDVHADDVARFDAVNAPATEQQDAEPKQQAKKATTAKKRT